MALIISGNDTGKVSVTPAGSGTFDVTIDGTEYTEAFDTDVATTIDNFITSHAATIASVHNILAVDGTTDVDFYNTRGLLFTSDTATVGAESNPEAKAFKFELLEDIAVSAAAITMTVGSGTYTFTFIDAATAEAMFADFVVESVKLDARATGSPFRFSKASVVTLA